MKFWLIKSEADCYSIDDLQKDKVSPWSGVRNYQARNFMRDEMKVGDLALFYHSSSKDNKRPNGVYGIAKVQSNPYPDETAFTISDEHFDKVSFEKREFAKQNKLDYSPTWFLVDFSFVRKFDQPFTLEQIKNNPFLKAMMVCQKGSRLSIQPVEEKHFNYIVTNR